MVLLLRKIEEREQLFRENERLREELGERFSFDKLIGRSPAMLAIYETISKIARYDTTVLVTGESGTGKELIARAVHHNSDRNRNSLVPVNCAAIPEELIESELFGSDKGAFTGAIKTRDGKFLQADGGTLFFDEIGDMSLSVQAKVLRALEQGEFERVGGSETIIQRDLVWPWLQLGIVALSVLGAVVMALLITTRKALRSDLASVLKGE